MQPYIFPYIGYFQLIHSVDTFVFYDDVNFIKRGWINRNKILVNNKAFLFTIPLIKASQNKLINETLVDYNQNWAKKILFTIEQNYKRAPYFKEPFRLVNEVFLENNNDISSLAISSVKGVSRYLGLDVLFEKSSSKYSKSKHLSKADRLIFITKQNESVNYINFSSGEDLYDKDYFKKANLNLKFITNNLVQYQQFSNAFISDLSIIDVLMFNSKKKIRRMLSDYTLR